MTSVPKMNRQDAKNAKERTRRRKIKYSAFALFFSWRSWRLGGLIFLPGRARDGVTLRHGRWSVISSHLTDPRLDLLNGLAQHARRLLHRHAFLRRQRQFNL